jgi:hypothetical protein
MGIRAGDALKRESHLVTIPGKAVTLRLAPNQLGLESNDMKSAKQEVKKMLDTIPSASTFEDIQYHIYVREKIETGLKDIREGRVLSQKEVEKRLSKWL